MGKSNQVHQLKLRQKITLMKNSEFCEDMSKSKNANRITLIIYLWLKRLIFLSFLLELCKNSGKWWTRDQNIDSYEEISFLSKISCFVTLQFVIITQFVIHNKLRWIATQFVIHRISNCVVMATRFVMYYKLRQNFIILKYWKGEKNWSTTKCIASIISYYEFS